MHRFHKVVRFWLARLMIPASSSCLLISAPDLYQKGSVLVSMTACFHLYVSIRAINAGDNSVSGATVLENCSTRKHISSLQTNMSKRQPIVRNSESINSVNDGGTERLSVCFPYQREIVFV